ncbi:uncharacterized protein LOC122683788 isoform X1 [Cervus elaphus]|uniref:uncharacterized protein LOC122683788 isoform X1 n=1 Tax=Cervus elaphus TaxID=9860 RepID=UPI001CC2FABF|nr:uncharacterized protein LOC122683788 isoform X1 [Cervus elaphus]
MATHSCLENPMDRGAWPAAQSWVQLKPLVTSTHVANEMGEIHFACVSGPCGRRRPPLTAEFRISTLERPAQRTRICNVCSAASDSLPFKERNGRFGGRPFCQRTEGRCSLIFTDSVPLLHSEVQAWPAQRGHFRGSWADFPSHVTTRVLGILEAVYSTAAWRKGKKKQPVPRVESSGDWWRMTSRLPHPLASGSAQSPPGLFAPDISGCIPQICVQ